jgi:acyl dehydratase
VRETALRLSFEEIEVGSIHSFERELSPADILAFAKLTGDFNPLHVDEEFGRASEFKQNIVHGMLAGSLFSTLMGMYCPGEKCLYLSQSLNFRKPIFANQKVLVRGTVTAKNDSVRMLTMKTEILRDCQVLISGEAKARIIGDQA